MPRNIEIKARIESARALGAKAAAIAEEGPIEIVQDDTFFACPNGRMKLRELAAGAGELIFYRRADRRGPKESYFLRSPTASPGTLRAALSEAYGQTGRVRKRRTLFRAGRTRIHLDEVEGLGHFLELEVELQAGEAAERGVEEALGLMARLGVDPAQLVEGAYVDLLAAAAAEPRAPAE